MVNIQDIFEKNTTYVEYARSGVEYYTENLEEAKCLVDSGWKYNKTSKGFRVVPPEVSIVDLTDYNKAMQYSNLYFNYLYFVYLKRLLKQNKLNSYIKEIIEKNKLKYKKFRFLVSIGPVLDTEIRIVGSDKRVELLKTDMVEKFVHSMNHEEYIQDYLEDMKLYKELEKTNIPLKARPKLEQEFYEDLNKYVSLVSKREVYNSNIFKIYNCEKIINEGIDVAVFLPFGCFKYLSSFVQFMDVRKIMFWELHADASKESTFKLYNKKLKDKKVLVVDNMYSGKTMKLIKNKIKECGGTPIVLGLNPKNLNNIKIADYVMILNTIYKKEELNTEEDNFFENLYVKTLRGGAN